MLVRFTFISDFLYSRDIQIFFVWCQESSELEANCSILMEQLIHIKWLKAGQCNNTDWRAWEVPEAHGVHLLYLRWSSISI
jgi:hypothetical protein